MMTIIEVNNAASRDAFLEVPKQLYKDDPNWVCLLDVEVEGIFNPESNDCFNYGEAIRWVLTDDAGALIGRIAAFYDDRKKNHSNVTAGAIGFFECINSQEAANLLFDTAKDWLAGRGMKAMDGSCNFGENLFHWGVLVEGFEQPFFGMPYNFPYYQQLFENYGFKDFFQQLSYTKDHQIPWPERQYKFAKFLVSRPDYSFAHFSFAQKEKFIDDLVSTYNEIWSDFHEDYTPLEREQIERMFADIKDMLDPEMIWFAYAEDRPIGMVVGLPDVNVFLKKIGNGKLSLWNKLRLGWMLKFNKRSINRCRVIMSGVVPDYQQKGVIGALFFKLSEALVAKGVRFLDMAWTGDYNQPVLKVYESVGAEQACKHITYRYIWDNSAVFERFTNEGGYKARKEKKEKKE